MTDTAEAELQATRTIPRKQLIAWGLWDWGSAAFNAVITTFVFTVYLTSTPAFGSTAEVTADLGWWLAGAGLVVAVLAPIMGQRTDGSGRRKLWLGVNTAAVVILSALMFFVEPKAELLVLGLFLISAGTVFLEFAGVNYNAMLTQVSNPDTIGRTSGFGWAMGYFGGILLLLVLYFGFIHPEVGLFGITANNGLSVRVSMLIAALWFALSAIPVLLTVPGNPPTRPGTTEPVGFIRSYALLGRHISGLWRTSRHTVLFLLASAIFRDGLTGVFTFGGVIAAGTFGFSASNVIVFAIAANVFAGVSTLLIGQLDDRLGAKPVMLISIGGVVLAGLALLVFRDGGQTTFWIFGLIMCIFVGPAQSSSRSFLARIAPAGQEGELFGLYATTGKAATLLAPTMFALFVTVFGAQIWGVLGIAIVLIAGLVLLIPVKAPAKAVSR